MPDKITRVAAGASVVGAALLATSFAQPVEASLTVAVPNTKTETAITIRPFAAEMSTKAARLASITGCALFSLTRTDTDTLPIDCP